MAVIIVMLMLPWLVVVWMFGRATKPPAGPAPPDLSNSAGRGEPCAAKVVAGAWGALEIAPIVVEPPAVFFSSDFEAYPSRQWVIGKTAPDEARTLLAGAGLGRQAVEAALKTAAPDPAGRGLILTPPDELVRGLAPSVRAALYAELAKNPANALQVKPYQFRGSGLADWFANSEVPEQLVKKIRPLTYQRGELLCFSDLHLVLPEISSPLDRIRLLRVLYRAATLSLRLQIKPGASLDVELAYWGRGERRDTIEPILQSLRNQAGGGTLDVVYLLPDFARTRLYTYVNPTRGNPNVSRDCHWTSFNFFNELPDDRYGVAQSLNEMIQKEWVKINSPTQFGDVIVFFRPPGEALHSCVYIADDVVFTKNGVGFGAPFIFERLDDVIARYRQEAGEFTLKYLRRRAAAD